VESYLVEHYWPGVTVEQFQAATGRVHASALEMERGGAAIRLAHSTLVPEDHAAYCVFDAASGTLVEEAYARAGVRFERLVTAFAVPIDEARG
jgi:hypothetical protein